MNRKERKELERQRKKGTWEGRHPVAGMVLEQGRRRQKARIMTGAVVIVILLIFGGAVFYGLVHDFRSTEGTMHPGIHFFVESAHFTNSSGSWSFATTVRNTGSVYIYTVNITVPATGSTIGTLLSIPVGGTVNGTFPLSGVTNDTLYALEYYAGEGNLTYETTVPVIS